MAKRISIVLLSLFLLFIFSACTNNTFESTKKETISSSDNNEIITSDTEQSDENESEETKQMNSNILVVYFSATDTTKRIAQSTAEILNTDINEILPQQPYTDEDLAYYTNGRADREQSNPSVRPAISGSIYNIDKYDTIILGYPIWHSQAPRIISTFLESYDFSGKTIIPFCTSHSSGIGSSDTDLHSLCSDNTNWVKGKRFSQTASQNDIEEWLNSVDILKA
ncbi:MAG: flavodoxin [Eubacterium sp.]|nr:flavodoxin [Eubacterium sp.]